jgi:hypothetical protein
MRVQHSIEREIEVVEHIIEQLIDCLKIFLKSKMHEEFQVTLKDIQKCQQELHRLISKRAVAID